MTIKELREKYNLTQSALARSLGVSSNAISGIEAGRINLSPKMSAKIKEVYGEEVAAAAPVQKAAKKAEEAVAPIEAPVEKKAPAKKVPAKKKAAAEKPVETVTAEAAAPVAAPAAPVKAKKSTKKPEEAVETPIEKKAPAKKVSQKKAPAKKSAPKKAAAATPTIILQSPLGGEVSAEEILSKVGDVDKVYVRIDQNKLYWVKGDETGDKDIW